MSDSSRYSQERNELERVAALLGDFGKANDADDHNAGEWADRTRKEANDGLVTAFTASLFLQEVLVDLWHDLSNGKDLSSVGWSIHQTVVAAIVKHDLVAYRSCSLLVYGAYFGVQPYVEMGLEQYRADVNTIVDQRWRWTCGRIILRRRRAGSAAAKTRFVSRPMMHRLK
jgi:hypothetical protein